MEATTEAPFCARCGEDFPVQDEPNTGWRMGELRRLAKAPETIRRQFRGGVSPYLCGNCYYDLTDDDDA